MKNLLCNIRTWSALWLALFLLGCLHTVLVMFHHVPLDYNEGWNAQLASWSAGLGGRHSLYSSADGFVFNNYPPLSFVLIGALVWLGSDAVIAGRIISCLSVLLSGLLLARIVWNVTGRQAVALATASIFLLTASTAFSRYCGMDDPQWLAQALMLGGLCTVLGRGVSGLGKGRLFLGAVLVVLGGFTKHNLLALPLALFVWLLLVDRKKAGLWALMGVALLLAGFAACYEVYGASFFHDVFFHQRIIRLSRVSHGLRVLPLMGGVLVAGLWLLWRQRRDISRRDAVVPVLLYLLFGLVFGLLEAVGDGVDYNCMFDAFIAATLLCGLGLARLPATGATSVTGKLCLLMSLPLLLIVPAQGMSFYRQVQSIWHEDSIWQQNIAVMKAQKGPLLATDMLLGYWAGDYDAVDQFNLTESQKKHRDSFPLRAQIAGHRFARVQVYGSARNYSSGIDMLDAWLLQAGYRPALVSEGGLVLLAPSGQGIQSSP